MVAHRVARAAFLGLVAAGLGCPADDTGGKLETEGALTSSTSTSTSAAVTSGASGPDATSQTGADSASVTDDGADPCAEIDLPACEVCPADFAALCGLPCSAARRRCGDVSGSGLECLAGTWNCTAPARWPPEGCDRACEPVSDCVPNGCQDGIALALTAAGGFEAGTYTVAAELESGVHTCSFELSSSPDRCSTPVCATQSSCDAVFTLAERPPRIAVLFARSPTFAVTVTRGTELLAASSEHATVYQLHAPSGPGCAPVCAVAPELLTLAP